MALTVNCDGFQRDRYFARSWALITQDEGWVKPILLLTIAQFIPILGPLGANGYIVEWARLIAWNTNAAPKQHSVNVGECIVSGWRTFVVYLGWVVLICLAFGALALVPIAGPLLVFAFVIFNFYLEQLLRVAALRASIYQQISAGYKGGRIWEMGERDVDGIMHIIGIEFIASLVITVLASVVSSIVMVAVLPSFIGLFNDINSLSYTASSQEVQMILETLINSMISFAPAFVIMGIVTTLLSTLMNMILFGAVALWMRQFNVAAWGRSDDPLPQPLPETVVYYQNAPLDPNQGYGYAPQQNYGYAPQQTYDPYAAGYAEQQAYAQPYDQAYNQAYVPQQSYGYTAPQQAEYTPEAQYVPEAAFVPEAAVVPEAAYVAEPVTVPVVVPEPATEPIATPEPEAPQDAE